MGIKGLTTFVRNRSQYCMEPYKLHDTALVIDGDAIYSELYISRTPHRNASFGGDYDKFGKVINEFFDILETCNVTPYIVFDGGYESRKMDTMLNRHQKRIKEIENVTPRTQKNSNCFPLFIRVTFEDIAVKRKITMVRCDFEADREAASIAKALNCPVMSNDSDYFMFDVTYIPFTSFKMRICGNYPKYIACEIFNIDKFIKCLGCFNKQKLHLLSAMIGNDFKKGTDLTRIGLKENANGNELLKRIESLISWLRKETYESALTKILNSYKKSEQANIKKNLENAVTGYTLMNSRYLDYLRPDLVQKFTSKSRNNEEVYEYNTYEKVISEIPKPFIENYRRCLYSPRLLEIFTQNKYYNFRCQVEVTNMEHTHIDSVRIMSAVHKILKGPSENLVCIVRIKKNIGEQILPSCQLDLPSFTDIQEMDLQARRKTLLKILNIDSTFITKDLSSYPESWYLLMLTLKYMILQTVISWPVVYSIITCKIIISYVDPQIGFFRSNDKFDEKFFDEISELLYKAGTKLSSLSKTLQKALDNITYNEALLAMSQLIPYLEVMDSIKYDKNIVHEMSRFQSVLLHVKNLNLLLNKPFENFLISDCFNGTFIYNFSEDLGNQNNLDDYMRKGLKNSPVVLNCFRLVIDTLKEKK